MAITWEWKLKKEVGPDRFAKFAKNAADEESVSCAMALQWLQLSFTTPVKDQNFGADIVSRLAPVTKLVKAKGFLGNKGAQAAQALVALGTDVGVAFDPKTEGKVAAGKSQELAEAIKKLDKDGLFLVYLFSTAGKVYHTVALQRKTAEKRVFDPYQGQFVAKESSEAADEIAKIAGFDGFALLQATRGAIEGPAWDWDFSQGTMIDELQTGKYRATRQGGKMQTMFPGSCGGICLAMSYDWIKTTMANKPATSASYQDPKKFLSMAKVQHKVADNLLALQPQALKEGYKFAVDGNDLKTPSDAGFPKAVMGYFDKKTVELAFKIDQIASGFYIFWISGKGGEGHFMAFQKTAKETGKFFDPNIGQCTVRAGGETVGALAAAVAESLYKEDFVDCAKDPANGYTNAYWLIHVTK